MRMREFIHILIYTRNRREIEEGVPATIGTYTHGPRVSLYSCGWYPLPAGKSLILSHTLMRIMARWFWRGHCSQCRCIIIDPCACGLSYIFFFFSWLYARRMKFSNFPTETEGVESVGGVQRLARYMWNWRATRRVHGWKCRFTMAVKMFQVAGDVSVTVEKCDAWKMTFRNEWYGIFLLLFRR